MKEMKITPLEKIIDDVWGAKGTPNRDAMEEQLRKDMQAYFIGEAIKNARVKQNLTQDELGERIGVKKSQICKLEKGKCPINIDTMTKVFKALGVASATLDLGKVGGKIALW